MTTAAIVFPNQLFRNPALPKHARVYLVEEYLFFRQYHFHKQKIAFHRASMKYYEVYLQSNGYQVEYIDAKQDISDIRSLLQTFKTIGVAEIHLYDPVDDWLHKRIQLSAKDFRLHWYDNRLFLTSKADIDSYFGNREVFHQSDFYKYQRKRLDLLMEGNKPLGGKWSYDAENRKKYPANSHPPPLAKPSSGTIWDEACKYTNRHFSDHPGELSVQTRYPLNFTDADRWFDDFLQHRFHAFGIYEDSIVKDAHFLHHSVISPLLNTGLLDIKNVIDKSLAYGRNQSIPLNSMEGFLRQLIGWREYVRGVYEYAGAKQRRSNFWGHTRKIPSSFYNGTTGITPIDCTINKVLRTGYAHHIERLMVLSNFMNLCGFHPDEVYKWFMDLFIDAYDWVMVPNIYGMSLFADGGKMSTKPYISGSNYLLKMSDYSKGAWSVTWDGLFWHFIAGHIAFFESQPRLSMLATAWKKMEITKKNAHLGAAEAFLLKNDK